MTTIADFLPGLLPLAVVLAGWSAVATVLIWRANRKPLPGARAVTSLPTPLPGTPRRRRYYPNCPTVWIMMPEAVFDQRGIGRV